jgi:hypothetical protein
MGEVVPEMVAAVRKNRHSYCGQAELFWLLYKPRICVPTSSRTGNRLRTAVTSIAMPIGLWSSKAEGVIHI